MPNSATATQSNNIDEFFVPECWQDDRPPVLQDEQTAHIQDSRLSCLPDFLNARMQDCRKVGKQERMLSIYPAHLMECLKGGMKARRLSYQNECRAAALQGSRYDRRQR